MFLFKDPLLALTMFQSSLISSKDEGEGGLYEMVMPACVHAAWYCMTLVGMSMRLDVASLAPTSKYIFAYPCTKR